MQNNPEIEYLIEQAVKIARDKKHEYVLTEHLLLSLVQYAPFQKTLDKYGVEVEAMTQELDAYLNSLVSLAQVGLDMGPTQAQIDTWVSGCTSYNGTVAAWKKAKGAVLKLEIPADAQRTSSLVGRKCRASAAVVLEAFGERFPNVALYDDVRQVGTVDAVVAWLQDFAHFQNDLGNRVNPGPANAPTPEPAASGHETPAPGAPTTTSAYPSPFTSPAVPTEKPNQSTAAAPVSIRSATGSAEGPP